MKRTLSGLLVVMMLLCVLPVSAQESAEAMNACIAQFSDLTHQEELTQLEKQILELKLRYAQLSGDTAAVDEFTAELALVDQNLADIAARKEDAAVDIVDAITQREQELQAELAVLNDTLARTQAQIDMVNASLATLGQHIAFYKPYADAALTRNMLIAAEEGFMSAVKVFVNMSADGTIASIKVDSSGELFGQSMIGEGFLNQFIGREGPFINLDVVSGATYTSKAIIKAVNSLFSTERSATAKGLLSDVKVYVTLRHDGTIAAMTVDASGETHAIARPCTEAPFLSNFIGRKGPFHDIDVVSGATYTSNAVINAVNSLFD